MWKLELHTNRQNPITKMFITLLKSVKFCPSQEGEPVLEDVPCQVEASATEGECAPECAECLGKTGGGQGSLVAAHTM
jgi:hypothetical protein